MTKLHTSTRTPGHQDHKFRHRIEGKNSLKFLTVARRSDDYTRKNLTSCSKSANKLSTSCVRTACYKLSTSLEQAANNL